MYYNGKKGVHTNVFLNEVHAKVNQKYLTYAQGGDVEQAKKLQNFFQNLKTAAQNIDALPEGVDKAVYSQLLNEIELRLKGQKLESGIKNLFRRYSSQGQRQGDYFERELVAVLQAVAYKAGDEMELPATEIRIGQDTGTTTLTDEILEQIKEGIAKGLSEEQAFKQVATNIPGFQKRVAIKTDIQGIHIDIVASADEITKQIQEIQLLLENATFSAKSYSSKGWNNKTQTMEVIQDLYPTIHLGNSNPYRAVYGSLTSLGYSHRTTTSAYSAATNLINKGVQNTINHIYHLRYLYELTGAGTKTLNGLVKEARFLIYNDPSSDDIFVKSTAEILLDVFETPPDWTGDPFGGISISKNKFQ